MLCSKGYRPNGKREQYQGKKSTKELFKFFNNVFFLEREYTPREQKAISIPPPALSGSGFRVRHHALSAVVLQSLFAQQQHPVES